jgi:thiazole synthase ThiGH ThiG subunit
MISDLGRAGLVTFKLKIHGYLPQGPAENFHPAELSVKEDFTVLPWMSADPALAKGLQEHRHAVFTKNSSKIHERKTFEKLCDVLFNTGKYISLSSKQQN